MIGNKTEVMRYTEKEGKVRFIHIYNMSATPLKVEFQMRGYLSSSAPVASDLSHTLVNKDCVAMLALAKGDHFKLYIGDNIQDLVISKKLKKVSQKNFFMYDGDGPLNLVYADHGEDDLILTASFAS